MTQIQNKTMTDITEALMASGFEKAVPDVMTAILNQAMIAERENHLQAKAYERSEDRQGYFYPACLEKGLRSERALYATLASMYIEGVSTRKVTKVLEKMCGLSVSSTQVSRCTKQLDDQLEAWRDMKPLGTTAMPKTWLLFGQ